jgi:hypothetical protein
MQETVIVYKGSGKSEALRGIQRQTDEEDDGRSSRRPSA